MKHQYLQAFVCPKCKQALEHEISASQNDTIQTGTLTCSACQITYPIEAGIPRFARDLTEVKKHTAASFGYKWQKFSQIDDYYKKNFIDELAPLDHKNFFKNKRVLDAGTGMGIPSYCMAEMGAKEVFAIDISNSIEVAHHNTKSFDQVTVSQADIYNIPFPEASFDAVVCVAVLQHLPDYPKAIEELIRYVKPGGKLILWVYAREGNGFVQWVIEPFRKIITRNIPVKLTLALSYPIGILFQLIAKGIYKPLNKIGLRMLPLNDYILYRTHFDWRMNTHMIFDQLLAPVSYLFTKNEMVQFMSHKRITQYDIRHHNKNSWTVIAQISDTLKSTTQNQQVNALNT